MPKWLKEVYPSLILTLGAAIVVGLIFALHGDGFFRGVSTMLVGIPAIVASVLAGLGVGHYIDQRYDFDMVFKIVGFILGVFFIAPVAAALIERYVFGLH